MGYCGDHSRTIALVQTGAYAVGAVNFKVWENETKAGRIDPDRVGVIWRTPPYPDYQWTIRGDVDARWGAGFTDRVRQALLAMHDVHLALAYTDRIVALRQGRIVLDRPTAGLEGSDLDFLYQN